VADLLSPGIDRVVEAAFRKGVALDIRLMAHGPRNPADAAGALGADLGQMVRSLVFVATNLQGRLTPILCLVSCLSQVDLALTAALAGAVSVRPATAVEAYELTGYSDGMVPPFGHDRNVTILMDQDLCAYQWVWASAGAGGAFFRVAPRTLRMLANAIVAPLAWTGAPDVRAGRGMETQLRFGTGAQG
jgi:prolyl-tRNA editing enzyme YbaK/EbsC (Cys-tRNA(Pro) deacylase)